MRIVLLAKVPQPGRVKTRLVPALGPEGAAALQAAMAEDVAITAASVAPLAWHVDGPLDHPWARRRTPLAAQAPGDLGVRLAQALDRGPALALGADSPTLPAAHLRQALAGLDTADVCLGPAVDGGCWCIGWRRPLTGWFDGVPWSTPEVMAALMQRAHALGAQVHVARWWYDVDDGADLERLRQHLRWADPTLAPCTRAALESLCPT